MIRKVKKLLIISAVIFGVVAALAVWFEGFYMHPSNFNTLEASNSKFFRNQDDFIKMSADFKGGALLDLCKTGRYEYMADYYYYDLSRDQKLPEKYLSYKNFLDAHPYIQCIRHYIGDGGSAVLFEVNSYRDGTSVGYMFKPDNAFKAFGAATSTILKGFEIAAVPSMEEWFTYRRY